MATYYLPRDTKGEGRILYIFSTKALIYTIVGVGIGAFFKWIIGLFGDVFPSANSALTTIGWIIMIILGIAGFVIGTVKVPQNDKWEITKKAAGIPLDKVIWEYIKFNLKKDKYYVYDTRDLVREQVEKEVAEEEKQKAEKEAEREKQIKEARRKNRK